MKVENECCKDYESINGTFEPLSDLSSGLGLALFNLASNLNEFTTFSSLVTSNEEGCSNRLGSNISFGTW